MGFDPANPHLQKLLADAERDGRLLTDRIANGEGLAPVGKAKRKKPALVAASFEMTDLGPVWVLPLHVTAGDNARGSKAKIGRAGHERRVVSRCLGGATLCHLAPFAFLASRGERVTVRMTVLGGQEQDDDNAIAACKYIRDAVCLMLGFGDGRNSPLAFVVDSEPGGACGVRIELRSGETA